MCGYHTTVTPWIVGEKEAREILGLTKELDTIDDHEWQNQMSFALKWQAHASRMRLISRQRRQTSRIWSCRPGLSWSEDWLRPSHPLNEERELREQDEVTYSIAARVPSCALWNLLDYRDEDGVPLITVVECR